MNIAKIQNNCCPKPKSNVNFGANISEAASRKLERYIATHSPKEQDIFNKIKEVPNIMIDVASKKMSGALDYLEISKQNSFDSLLIPLTSMEKLKKAVELLVKV